MPHARPAPATPGRVLLAAPRGYCAGVERAVRTVEEALRRWGPPVYVRHEIVHNKHVVEDLRAKGAVFVDSTEHVPEGARVIFSAHGVAPAVHDEAAARSLSTIDATCPLVTKVHREAVHFAADGYDILLTGHHGHEEVIGTMGHAPDRIHLVDSPQDVGRLQVRDENRVVWLSRTTLSVDEAMTTVAALRARFPALVSPPSDDICYATQNRQQAVRQIAPERELVLITGSANSSNSVRLVEVALDAGADAAHLIDSAEEVDPRWLDGVSTIGVSAGASAPETLVTALLRRLAASGYPDVQTLPGRAEAFTSGTDLVVGVTATDVQQIITGDGLAEPSSTTTPPGPNGTGPQPEEHSPGRAGRQHGNQLAGRVRHALRTLNRYALLTRTPWPTGS